MAKSNPRVIIERLIIERIVINVLIIKISSYRMTLLLKSYKTIFIEYNIKNGKIEKLGHKYCA